MTWPGHIPAGANYGEMMSHFDCWSTLAAVAGIPVPPTGEMKDNNGKPIYFDSIDNSAYILGKSPLCLSKISKCLSGWGLFLLHNSR
jgi:arylsulfatase